MRISHEIKGWKRVLTKKIKYFCLDRVISIGKKPSFEK